MKQILFFVFPLLTGLSACSSAKSTRSSVITQGITGIVTESSGNRMPFKDAPATAPRGMYAIILIYELTNLSQTSRVGESSVYTGIRTKQVASIQTDSTGRFTIALAPGSYSIFIRTGQGLYSNRFDAGNNISPFRVEEGKLTRVDVPVSIKATF